MEYTIKNSSFWLLFLLCGLTLLPFLGLAEYHSDGEPREAVVSWTMLVNDDWTLPRNNDGDMSFKPPFFHWCVNVAAIVRGDLTEGASRVPSTLALIGMTLWCFGFLARRKGIETGLLTALVAFTTYGLHRAGTVCRVDMMLTAATVCALYMFYRWYEQGMRDAASLILAVLLMGVATLTKGPVGSIIPCLVMGCYMLLRGTNPLKAFFLMLGCGLLSMVPYALWFYAAWLKGGQAFLDLVYAENIGRMIKAMGYESNVQPWYFNLETLLVGFLPWTLMLVVSLCNRPTVRRLLWLPSWRLHPLRWLREADPVDLFSLTAMVVVFIFYSIPQTKRLTYLLPMYPFVAYFVARYMLWMADNRQSVMRRWSIILSVLSMLVPILFLLLRSGMIQSAWLPEGEYRSVAEGALRDWQQADLWWQWLVVLIPAAFGLYGFFRRKSDDSHNILTVLFLTFGLWLAVDGLFAPAVCNSSSVRTASIHINHAAPASEAPLYEFIGRSVGEKGDYIHFFEVNFYLRNRIRNFSRRPDSGFLLITREDARRYLPLFEREGYRFRLHYEADRREMQVYAFTRTK
jgi:4-amino-4-deoxy-L-arabinose transferase-like glycosyltransferase